MITRQTAKAQAELATVQNLEGEGSLAQFAAHEALNIPNETLEAKVINGAKLSTKEIDQRVEQILDTRLAKHLAEWQEQFLKVLTETQIAANMSPDVEKPGVKEKGRPLEASTPFNKMSHCDDEGISQLVRKQKFVGTSIEVLMHEMHKLMNDEKSQGRLDKALERLNSLETEYSVLFKN
jgi:hypothetical protein